MSRTDAMAILKRSAFSVFGKNHITYRLPAERETKAYRIRWNKPDILLDTPKPKLRNFKEGGAASEDYEQHCAWEAASHLQLLCAPCHMAQ